MTALEFGEFGLCFDTFKEIVGRATDHEGSCGTAVERSADREVGCIDIRGQDFLISSGRLFVEGIERPAGRGGWFLWCTAGGLGPWITV